LPCYSPLVGLLVIGLLASTTKGQLPPKADPATGTNATSPADLLAPLLAELIRDTLPREYNKQEDWGAQREIFAGVKVDGLRVSKRKHLVDHGTWKRYRIVLDETHEPLGVSIENLRSLEAGKIGLRIVVTGRLNGWAQMRRYNRGVHIITITSEGASSLYAAIDCEIALQPQLRGVAIVPTVVSTQVEITDFELTKFGELRGELADGLGRGMKHVIQHQLDRDRLAGKLNKAVAKKQDRLVIDFASALKLNSLPTAPTTEANAPTHSPTAATAP
jgi:hypothetical protein